MCVSVSVLLLRAVSLALAISLSDSFLLYDVHLSKRHEERRKKVFPQGSIPVLPLPSWSFKIHTHTHRGERQSWSALCIRPAALSQTSFDYKVVCQPVCSVITLLTMSQEVEENKLSKETTTVFQGWWKADERKTEIGKKTADWLCVCGWTEECERGNKRARKKNRELFGWHSTEQLCVWKWANDDYSYPQLEGGKQEPVREEALNIPHTYSCSTIARV